MISILAFTAASTLLFFNEMCTIHCTQPLSVLIAFTLGHHRIVMTDSVPYDIVAIIE